MPSSLLGTFSDLTHVDWTDTRHQLWSNATKFRQRNIYMDLHVTGDLKQCALPDIVSLVRDDGDAHACIFVNFKSETSKWALELEDLFADELLRVGVLQINGDMDKHEKIAFVRLFTTCIRMGGYRPRVLVATAAANTGIDQPKLVWVLRVGFPRCLSTLLQERGRNARLASLAGMFAVFTNWKMFVKLLLCVLLRKCMQGRRRWLLLMCCSST